MVEHSPNEALVTGSIPVLNKSLFDSRPINKISGVPGNMAPRLSRMDTLKSFMHINWDDKSTGLHPRPVYESHFLCLHEYIGSNPIFSHIGEMVQLVDTSDL